MQGHESEALAYALELTFINTEKNSCYVVVDVTYQTLAKWITSTHVLTGKI